MNVTKRNGSNEGVDFNKITKRLRKLCTEMESSIDPINIAQKVCASVYNGVTTKELDTLSSEIAISMGTTHPDYATLAGYIVVSDLHKNIKQDFYEISTLLHDNKVVCDDYYNKLALYKDSIIEHIDYKKDYLIDYFGFKTLEKAYLHKINGIIVERPQDMWMRVALSIHDNLEHIIETYDYLSSKKFIHATPTLFNAGYNKPQMSSCFLLGTDDSINDIYKSLEQCAQISKWAGGIGMHIHDVRSSGASIREIQNASTGIVPMLRVFNATARYVNQSSKRNGSIAIYLSPEHPDIFDFLDLKKNTGDEERRCRDLFYAMWIPDLFMKRVESNEKWSLFCPKSAPGLSDVYGDEYEALYTKYENEKRYIKRVDAQKLWFAILVSQIETGTPYMLYKDAINKKSNQSNIGVIKSSNLCTEITEFTSKDEIAVCNLASISLPSLVKTEGEFKYFDFKELKKVSGILTRNLNKIIDKNYYPVSEAENSNKKHRPIGIGIQGLADVYMLFNLPFDSQKANELNADIFETIYYGAMEMSANLAEEYGHYKTFIGSPASTGKFQYDLWDTDPTQRQNRMVDWDWETLKNKVKKTGLLNSLLVAPMPTASTSQILGNNECFEPYTSNIYVRRTLAGEFVVVNKHLIKELINLNLWSSDMKERIIQQNGSIQNIPEIPQNIKDIYKTVWEISMKTIIEQAATRGPYVCQSQSMNLFVSKPTFSKLSSMHFYAWKQGLKTGMYYLRTKPASDPIKFTVDPKYEICDNCSA